jgi:hypothetical protein
MLLPADRAVRMRAEFRQRRAHLKRLKDPESLDQ